MKRLLLTLLSVSLVIVGGWLVWSGFNQSPEPTPTIETPVIADPNQTPVGPTENEVTVFPDVEGDEDSPTPDEAPTTVTMTPEEMAPNRLFIPSLNIYSRINTDGNIGSIRNGYLKLPHASEVTRWVEGSDVSSEEGSILLSGHVTYNGVKGVIHDLAYLKAGERAYVTDSKGDRQEFQLKTMTQFEKEALPDEIWSVSGPKTLNVITCGGELYRLPNGYYTYEKNIVATFVPVVDDTPVQSPAETLTITDTQAVDG